MMQYRRMRIESYAVLMAALLLSFSACSGQLGCDVSPCKFGGSCVNLATEPYYRCECLSEYTGPTCEDDYDECLLQSPCRNGGFCVNNFGSYECHCGPSWEGKQCEILVKKCAAYPCNNGATCTDVGDDYFCTCSDGFTGNNCQLDVDECLELSPCQNGAACSNNLGSYTCQCISGYQGSDCEEEIDECTVLSPCNNNSTCSDLINGYACICQPGFTGVTCDTPSSECNGVRCVYGSCVREGDSEDYTCRCSPGYTGVHCDSDIQECDSSPCISGDCVDRISGYECYCWRGYTGDRCEINIDDCTDHICVQGSTCVDGVGSYTCDCPAGYTGVDCSEEVDECLLYSPCQNGATCSHGADTYNCRCVTGYEGVNCTIDTDDCQTTPCIHGDCVDRLSGFHCNCLPGWSGDLCDLDIDECESSPCQNSATCTGGDNSYTCLCVQGFTGDDCDVNIDDCLGIDCNNGQCIDNTGSYTCLCSDGFTGQHCDQDIDECQVLSPCQNNATCVDLVNSYTCHCVSGYTGDTCQHTINPCVSERQEGAELEQEEVELCKNGGRCELSSPGEYQCVCPDGWSGRHCEDEIDECLEFSPCYNGATCVDLIADYRCVCAPGFNGSRCEINTNECSSSPCYHLATCVDLQNDYLCLCAPGYTGVDCSVDIDECSEMPCLNNGNCSQPVPGEFSCDCPDGISGLNCEQVNSVYLIPGGYMTVPVSAGAEATQDMMSLSFTYKTFRHSGVLLSISEMMETGQPRLLLVELIDANSVRVFIETGSGQASLIQRRAGNRIQVAIGNNGIALTQPPSVFTEDSSVNDTAGFLRWMTQVSLGSIPNITSFTAHHTESTEGFQGCLGNLTVNDERINLNSTAYNGELGCRQTSGCASDICYNDGVCVESWDREPKCRCTPAYTGQQCQVLLSSEFSSDQMLHIPSAGDIAGGEEDVTSLTFILSVRSLTQRAVILYTNNDNKLALYTDNGTVTATLLGVGFSLTCTVGLSHQLSVVSLQMTPYSVTVSSAALLNSTTGGVSSCTQSTTSRLSVRAPLYIGALHINPVMNIWRDLIGFSQSFIGCISNLTMNSRLISLSNHTPSGLGLDPPQPTPGCSRNDICTPDSCMNDGLCEGLWDKFECTCTETYSGANCSEAQSVTLDGRVSAITLQINPLLYDAVYEGSVSLRTRAVSSTILHAMYGTGSSVEVRVNDRGLVELRIHSVESPDFTLTHPTPISTGLWADVSWNIDRQVSLTVNTITVTDVWRRYQWLHIDTVDIYIGAKHYQTGSAETLVDHFMGCLRSLRFSHKEINLLDPQSEPAISGYTHDIRSGCHGDQVCNDNTCPINSFCVDGWNLFTCLCEDGWEGVDCIDSIDDCIGVDCNRGSCEDEHIGFRCDCQIGYTGDYCDAEVLACESSPCRLNQTSECISTPPLKYTCVCLAGYHGDICDLDIDECDSAPCLNDGVCTNLVNRFACDCKPGWEGVTCQINTNECLINPCAGNSQCLDEVNGYTCICSPGLIGDDCSIDIQECSEEPCLFDSLCTEPEPGKYECQCPDYLDGTHCDHVKAVTLLGSAHLSLEPIAALLNGGGTSDTLVIQFSITTMDVSKSQLLLFAMNEALYRSVTLEIVDSKLRLNVNTGHDVADITIPLQPRSSGIVQDQVKVTLSSQSDVMRLEMPRLSLSSSQRISKLDDLDLNSTLYIGGLPFHTSFTRSQILSSSNFIGCLSNLIINEQPINLLRAPVSNDSSIALGCQSDTSQCQSDSCNFHGVCVDLWREFSCRCHDGYQGERCEELSVIEFAPENLLYIPDRDTSLRKIEIEFSMDPSSSSDMGILLYTLPMTSSSAVALHINDSTISAIFLLVGGSLVTEVNNVKVTEGAWCTLSLEISQLSHELSVQCDGDEGAVSSTSSHSQPVEISGPLFIGALHSDNSASVWRLSLGHTSGAISGCLRNLRINENTVSFSAARSTPFSSDPPQPLPGCSRGDHCNDNNNRCSDLYGECMSNWTSSECHCMQGFSGDTCEQAEPLSFDGNSDSVTITADQTKFSLNTGGSFSFRTRQQQGTLLYLVSENRYLEFSLVESGLLQVRTPDQTLTTTASPLDDASWHFIRWELAPLTVYINDTLALQFSQDNIEWYRDDSVNIYLGAKVSSTGSRPTNNFKGCLTPLRLGTQYITPAVLPEGVTYISQGVVNGCHSDSRCQSAEVCPENAVCVDLWNDFDCQCESGWAGLLCDVSVDDCIDNSCVNGQCVDGHQNYTCQCERGYEGAYCDVEISMCDNEVNICLPANTEQCTDVFPLDYTCECKSGWTGRSCSEEINECSSDPCQNQAQCVDQINGFSCVCTEDYFGPLCETLRICALSPCNNGATCVPSDDNSLFVCRCTEEHFGEWCDIYNSCYQNDCEHGSTCLSDSLNRVYSCMCPEGYYGNLCQQTDYCYQHRCQNGADCVNLDNSYRCLCNQHYSGEFCSNVRDKCLNNSCSNRATCYFDPRKPESEYTCRCQPGYGGALCEEEINECLSSPCSNGECVDLVSRYECRCEAGWDGTNCDNNVNECSSNPCQNGAGCIDQVNGFVCSCRPGYEGELCDLDRRGCRSSPCLNGAVCQSEGGSSYSCLCSEGFVGPLCERNIDDCINNLCQFGSTCVDGIQDYTCDCLPGYTGEYCTEKQDSCYTSPCSNGGHCSYIGLCSCSDVNQICGFHDESCQRSRCSALIGCSLRDVSYQCGCTNTGYQGQQCQSDNNECEDNSHSCQHMSRCVNEPGGYSCDCEGTGFSGVYCTTDIDECRGAVGQTRCKNGGTCVNHLGSYVCICLDGWTGVDCTADISECDSNPCAHNSMCVEGVNGFICLCSAGYEGSLCTDNIDECMISLQADQRSPLCGISGTCVDTEGSYYCSCPDGTSGLSCNTEITSTEDHTTDLTSHMSSTSTEGGTAGSTEPQVAGTKYNVALVVTMTLLAVLLICVVVIVILYRYKYITPLPMKGSYRPDSMTNLPMSIQYNPQSDKRQILI